jgi:hypothetical protein
MQFLVIKLMTPTSMPHKGHEDEMLAKHNRGKESLYFHCRPAGPGYFPDIIREMDERKLARAPAPEAVSLIAQAYAHQTQPHYDLVLKTLRHESHVYANTGILVVKRAGVLVEHNPTIKDGRVMMKQNDLFARLGNDKNVKFVPEHPRLPLTGYVPAGEIDMHPLIIGVCGPEGAEKIAKFVRDSGKESLYIGSVPNLPKKAGRAVDEARIVAFRATQKKTFWIFSDYPDAHADVFGFSYGLIRREEIKSH